jgi:hypothetical protein
VLVLGLSCVARVARQKVGRASLVPVGHSLASAGQGCGDALHGSATERDPRGASVSERSNQARQPCVCSGFPASARWASLSASLCVGCAWIRPATSSGNASQFVISCASPASSLTLAPIM